MQRECSHAARPAQAHPPDTLKLDPPPQRPWPLWWVDALAWVLAALAVAAVTLGAQRLVARERAELTRAAQVELANLSRLMQEHALRTLQAGDQALQLVRTLYLREGERLQLASWVASGAIDAGLIHQVGVIDAQGIYRLSSLPVTPPVDLSDREHFRVHRAALVDTLFVSKPVIGRVSGKSTIQLTRRITDAQGHFAGVAVVSLDARYFRHFYDQLDLGADGLAVLVGADGVVRARRGGEPDGKVVRPAGPSAIALQAAGATEGFFERPSPADGVTRLHHFRNVAGLGLHVTVGLPASAYLTQLTHYDTVLTWAVAVSSGLIVMLTGGYTWQRRRERRSRQALLADRAKLALALSSGSLGVWDWDLRAGTLSVDDALADWLGFARGELRTDAQHFWDRIHPQDVAAFKAALTRVLRGQDERLQQAHRIQRKDGTYVWLMANGTVVARDAKGQVLRLIGVDWDLTQTMAQQTALRVAEVAFEAGAAMAVTDPQGLILRTNPTFAALTGYWPHETAGQVLRTLLHSGQHDDSFYASVDAALAQRGAWHGLVWHRRKSGELYQDQFSLTRVLDEQGCCTHLVSVHQDATGLTTRALAQRRPLRNDRDVF